MRTIIFTSLLLLTACAQQSSGEISNYLDRRWTWVDFISAGDLRRECNPNSGDKVRFVLNADRSKQVRIYDLDVAASTLRIRILNPRVSLKQIPLDSSIFNLFSPSEFTVRLEDGEAKEIWSAFSEDNARKMQKAPGELLTEWHFWLAGACTNGSFGFDVWVSPDQDYQDLKFPVALLQRDISNIAVVRQGAEKRLSRQDYNPARQQGFSHYILHVRDDRLDLGQNYGEDQSD